MLLTEYNETETMELFKEEGREEGILTAIKELMNSMKWSAQQAMDALKISAQDQKKFMSML